ncbi:hypothetical protein GCM10010284_34910 [Streptomyces rubiginosohelvolus]|uniref:Uncharacterized protein n=1 Tax=Streptomyces rubiginosohelvolus TaxID=67362 RepID=A0ABQ3BIF0_9ACTN|nr:hypothetical protein GCM10010284_34910 [Streptomyces rubiginosohelvolus]GGZ45744.1 hypothetical protein GCM10010328_20350 [Streptomyces pluricolorescens]
MLRIGLGRSGKPSFTTAPYGFLIRPTQHGETVNHGELLRDGRARAVAVEGGRLTLGRWPSASQLLPSRAFGAHEPRELLDGGVLRHSIPFDPASQPSTSLHVSGGGMVPGRLVGA